MLKTYSRTFRTAAWLGWQIESNWTDPLMFLAFSILKPVTSVLILVFMYHAVAGVRSDAPIYAYIYLGNAFYIYVGAVMAGSSYSILDDRERYRTLKYLYVAPIAMPIYLIGRAVARFVTGTIAVLVTLLAGVLLFNVPVQLGRVDWPLFAAAMALGLLSMTCMGIILGAWTMTLRTDPWMIGEAFAAALYLFSGAIFPISILPGFLQPLGFGLPITYWLELVRRALLGPDAAVFPTLAGFSNAQLFGILGAMTAALALLTALSYRFFDRLARERGMIDSQNNF